MAKKYIAKDWPIKEAHDYNNTINVLLIKPMVGAFDYDIQDLLVEILVAYQQR